MQMIELFKGVNVSRFGLGCMRLPKTTDAEGKEIVDEAAAIEMIRYAIDNGVNYIDTAYVYGNSEEIVGKALKDGYREKVVLATKLPVSSCKSKEDLQKYLDEELARLQTDYIDVYFLHNLHKTAWAKVLEYDAFAFMQDLKAKGIIKYIAVSLHEKFDHFKEVLDAYPWDLSMLQYSYYYRHTQAGEEGVKYAKEKGIPMVIMEPLHGGMLANEMPKAVADAFGDFGKGMSNAKKSFMWLYDQPEVTLVISGCSALEQVKENIEIFSEAKTGVLTDADKEAFERARLAWESLVNVNCTACGYCMPCPGGVDIPTVFHVYNELAKTDHQKWLYALMCEGPGKDASKCIECGMCEPKCPQFIPIIEKLKEAHKAFKG